MILDKQLIEQVKQYLTLLENDVVIRLSVQDDDNSQKVRDFVETIASLSDRLFIEEGDLPLHPAFELNRKDEETGIIFAGIPLGHEFESFILALLQVGGRTPKITDEQKKRIASVQTPMHFTTFVSLTCHNCPDVVQAFNIMAILNPNISHTMIEGGMFQDLVAEKNVLAVPVTFKDNESEIFASGRQTLDSLLNLIVGEADESTFNHIEPFDSLIIGGGPAGATAAIYSARKGIRTGLIAKNFGGQVMDTLGIENITGKPYTEGPQFMSEVHNHLEQYPIELIENSEVAKIQEADLIEVFLSNGAVLKSKSLILATGARWKDIHVPGEKEFKNKGIAYCVHCDGPLFKGKDVAVIGGGNSGVEAALDLSGMVRKVFLLEYSDHLNADSILQERLAEKENIDIILNAETTAITGDNTVSGLTYTNRVDQVSHDLAISGCFIQVGLLPNTEFLRDTITLNDYGEVITDDHGATNIPGVYAAGDCTTVPHKQIVIAMGAGAIASLSAFDYLIRSGK